MRRIIAVVCAVLLGALAFAAWTANSETGRGLLWTVVQTCVANHALTGAAFPCLEVNDSSGEHGYAILRRPGDPDFILVPTRKIVGVEDPSLQTADAPNYFQDAWNARSFLSDAFKKPLARNDVALAVNSRITRSQDQLHIHIGCLSQRAKKTLQALAAELPEDEWVRIGNLMRVGTTPYRQGLWGRRVGQDTLEGVNPFHLATEGRLDPQLLIVVTGIQLPDGRGGFALLASRNDRFGPIDQASAEDILDPSCSL